MRRSAPGEGEGEEPTGAREELVRPLARDYFTPSFSAAIRVPSIRFLIFWNAISRA